MIKNEEPFLSIITICYNNAEGLKKTLNSVRKLKTNEIEYIVVDGKSTDETSEILNQNKDIIDIQISEKDDGIYNAINKGIKLSHGSLIGLIHSGDFYLENAFCGLKKLHESHPDSILYGALKAIKNDEFDTIWGLNSHFLPEKMIPHLSSFVPKCIYDKYGTYDERYKIAADYDCFLRFYQAGVSFIFTDTIICAFNLDGVSQHKTNETEKEVERIKKNHGVYIKPSKKTKLKKILKKLFNFF